MNHKFPRLVVSILAGLRIFFSLSSTCCFANEVNKEPNVNELAGAFIFSLQIASSHLEHGDEASLDEKRLQAELLVARIFRLWMSEKNSLDAYPKNFFIGVRVAMGNSLEKLGLNELYADPLRVVINSYRISPLINQEFGRPPDTISLKEFMENPEIYRKFVTEFLRELGLDTPANSSVQELQKP